MARHVWQYPAAPPQTPGAGAADPKLALKKIIFAGAGHANIAALRILARQNTKASMVLVNDGPFAWYTATVPALLRGEITEAGAMIDIAALAAKCGAEFIDARMTGFDSQSLHFAGGGAENFDYLAISTGGVQIAGGVKPITEFLRRVAVLKALPAPRLGIVGTGPAGVELALALRIQLGGAAKIYLWGNEVIPTAPRRAQKIASDALAQAGIHLVHALPESLDDTLHAYTPEPELSLRPTLQVTGHETVFATGDCARFTPVLPRSGAIAVQQGRVLAKNLRRALAGARLKQYRPRPTTLAIMTLNTQSALAWYGSYTLHGPLATRLKHWIDGRWMEFDENPWKERE